MATLQQTATAVPTVLAGVTPGNAVALQPLGGDLFVYNGPSAPNAETSPKFVLEAGQFYRVVPAAGEQTYIWRVGRKGDFPVIYEATT